MHPLVSATLSPKSALSVAPTAVWQDVADAPLTNDATLRDALKLRATALPQTGYSAGIKLVLAVDGATDEDPYTAASSATSLVSHISPALSRSIVGAALNAMVLGTGGEAIRTHQRALATRLNDLADKPHNRVDAALGVATSGAQLSVLYRAFANSALAVTNFCLRTAAKVPALAAGAKSLTTRLAGAAKTPVGRTLGFLNKWIPLLNAAWILVALKAAYDVHNAPNSSTTSKALAALNVGCATAVLIAGLASPGGVFLVTVVAGLGVDLMLAQARYTDSHGGRMDAHVAEGFRHPGEALAKFGRWLARMTQVGLKQSGAKVEQKLDRVEKMVAARPRFEPGRTLVKSTNP